MTRVARSTLDASVKCLWYRISGHSMFCDNCGSQVGEDFNFCPQCGEAISTGFTGIAPCIRNNLSEEEAIRLYFGRGYQYNLIGNLIGI